MMTLNPDNIAQHLISFGYSAKAGTIADKKTGEAQPVVFINGLGSINAYLNLSEDPAKFGLKVFGNLQPGYAPVVLDENGEVMRVTVIDNGQRTTRAKRGEPLDAEALKRKNNEISLAARKEISAAVLAAYMLELGGGDLEKIRDGFRLQKWDRSAAPKSSVEAVDLAEPAPDASEVFNDVAPPEAAAEPGDGAPRQEGRKVKRGQSATPKI
jgi:hypothetical protein